MTPLFFQINRPVYIKTPFNGAGKDWKVDSIFPWEYHKIPMEVVKTLFDNDFLKHSDYLEETTEEKRVGDGLNDLSSEQLSSLVNAINTKLKLNAKHITEYNRKKIPVSKIKDKQVGLIRRWRLTYGDLE
jgi:hypothetical protein